MHVSDLSQALLKRYLHVLYGQTASAFILMRPAVHQLEMLWTDMLGLDASDRVFKVGCDKMVPGILHNDRCGWQREWDAPSAVFVGKTPLSRSRAAASHSWVEVTHCSEVRKLRLKRAQHTTAWCQRGGRVWCFENTTTWYYMTVGSGIFFNVGRTIAFPDPQTAIATLAANISCVDPSCRGDPLERAFDRLRNGGYRTVQFYNFQDQRCNLTTTNLVDLHRRGLQVDPCQDQAFRTAEGRCDCVSEDGCARCLPRNARATKGNATKLCGVCPVVHPALAIGAV